ncbi:hypothetical protein [Pedobacter sp. B4-66]|uniref:hypothetical protein n=1 Tax=Pedobacter sp. B4-66 TaxID=2817280 RepID=UPI001BD95FB1|nr:hypothetical protein [Pedobacter sp. B4-66]
MEVTDMEGRTFEIIDLAETIKMVEGFLAFTTHSRFISLQVFERRRLAYWNDFLQKLLELQRRLT